MSYVQTVAQTVMPEELIALCMPFGTCQHYCATQTIHNRGSKNSGLSIVVEGEVKIGNYGLDGSYQITTTLTRGETFGEFTLYASLARTHHAQAINDCRILQISEPAYRRLISSHDIVSTFISRSLAIKLHTVLERLDDMRRLPTHVQLAKLIYQGYLMSNQRLIKLRQSDYAERLGVTVLTAHKALNTLLTLNLIEKKYGGVEIVNTQKLAEYLSDNTSLLPL